MTLKSIFVCNILARSPQVSDWSYLYFNLILGTDCIDKFDYWCPIYKKAYGCSFVIRPDFRDSINNLCPMTCGLCGAMHHVSPWRSGGQYHGVVQNWRPGSQYGQYNRRYPTWSTPRPLWPNHFIQYAGKPLAVRQSLIPWHP